MPLDWLFFSSSQLIIWITYENPKQGWLHNLWKTQGTLFLCSRYHAYQHWTLPFASPSASRCRMPRIWLLSNYKWLSVGFPLAGIGWSSKFISLPNPSFCPFFSQTMQCRDSWPFPSGSYKNICRIAHFPSCTHEFQWTPSPIWYSSYLCQLTWESWTSGQPSYHSWRIHRRKQAPHRIPHVAYPLNWLRLFWFGISLLL